MARLYDKSLMTRRYQRYEAGFYLTPGLSRLSDIVFGFARYFLPSLHITLIRSQTVERILKVRNKSLMASHGLFLKSYLHTSHKPWESSWRNSFRTLFTFSFLRWDVFSLSFLFFFKDVSWLLYLASSPYGLIVMLLWVCQLFFLLFLLNRQSWYFMG